MSIPDPVLSAQVLRVQDDAHALAKQFIHLTAALAALLENTEVLRHQAWAVQRTLAEMHAADPTGIPQAETIARTLRRFQEIGRQLETVAEPLRLNLPELARMTQEAGDHLEGLTETSTGKGTPR